MMMPPVAMEHRVGCCVSKLRSCWGVSQSAARAGNAGRLLPLLGAGRWQHAVFDQL